MNTWAEFLAYVQWKNPLRTALDALTLALFISTLLMLAAFAIGQM